MRRGGGRGSGVLLSGGGVLVGWLVGVAGRLG